MLLVSTFRVSDIHRPLRNPFVRAKVPLFVSGGALAVVWLTEGRSYVAHGSGIIVAWGCEPPAPMSGASMCQASSSSPGGWSHRGGLLLGLSCQFGSQYRSSLHLLGHFVRFLFVPLSLPRILPPGSSSSIPSLGSSLVVHHLYPRVSADREYFSTLHGTGVDEHDFARWSFPEAIALVDEPLVNQHLYCP